MYMEEYVKMDSGREIAWKVLMDIEKKEAYSNIALNRHLSGADVSVQRFVRELVYGVLRHRKLIDWYIDALAKSGISKIKTGDLTVLRMGIYQIEKMDSVPEFAAISESVDLAKKHCRGRHGFINAVLRSYIRKKDKIKLPEDDDVKRLSVEYSYDESITKMWIDQFGQEYTRKLMEAGNCIPPLTVRANISKISRDELGKKLRDEGFEVSEGILCDRALNVSGSGILGSEMYRDGLFSVQDESAMFAADVLGAEPGDTVIDVCAAPGGKSFASAERMNDSGRVLAFDIYARKTEVMGREAERLGLSCVETDVWDALSVKGSLISCADRVIADVPCSGLGVVRRKPELKYRAPDGSLPEIQLNILRNASQYVKRGGRLVYSTCTVNKRENEDVVNGFLKEKPCFALKRSIQLDPYENMTDGFYIAEMVLEG